CVEYKGQGAFAQRARIYGPLWTNSMAHGFAEENRKAAAKTPFVGFDADGNVQRIEPDNKGGPQPRSVLRIEQNAARWQKLAPFVPPPIPIDERKHEARAQTRSGLYE